MRAAVLVILPFSVACAVGACGSDATTADGDAGASDAAEVDAADAGHDARPPCLAKQDGPRSGSVVTVVSHSVGADGGVEAGTARAEADWNDPEQAEQADGTFATSSLDTGAITRELHVTGFGFTVPANGHVLGIEVELKRQADSAGVLDDAAHVIIGGDLSTGSHYLDGTVPWPVSALGTHVYGNSGDLWGADSLSPNDVNAASFGAEIAAKRAPAAAGPATAKIDSLRITVHWCE